jgi:acid phosphatase (class A)
VAHATDAAKDHYKRARPFVLNKHPICTPDDEKELMKSSSYPSGHAAVGWAWALILTEISPARTDAILADLEAARSELAGVRLKGLKPLRDCASEGAASGLTAR